MVPILSSGSSHYRMDTAKSDSLPWTCKALPPGPWTEAPEASQIHATDLGFTICKAHLMSAHLTLTRARGQGQPMGSPGWRLGRPLKAAPDQKRGT